MTILFQSEEYHFFFIPMNTYKFLGEIHLILFSFITTDIPLLHQIIF